MVSRRLPGCPDREASPRSGTGESGTRAGVTRRHPVRTASIVFTALVLGCGLLASGGTSSAAAAPAQGPDQIADSSSAGPAAADAATARAPAARRGYRPEMGAMFNNPLAGTRAERRLLGKIRRAIKNTPRRSTIRIAIFSFADKTIADALVRAHRRGVNVKLIMSDANTYGQMRRMKRVLGTNRKKSSFAYQCRDSCRSTRGQMHAKYFSFRRSGESRFVTMVGSVNLTRHNATHQWNDLYTVADYRVFRAYNRWFSQLKADRPRPEPYVRTSAGFSRIDFTPIDLRRHRDPVLRALGRVSCRGGTSVDISAYAWNGMRGRDIARRVAALKRDGCRTRAILGKGTGSAVRSILAKNRVVLKRSRVRGVTTHQKMMVVRGGIDGTRTGRAWTGSHNWSSRSAVRDDLFVEIADQRVVAQYQAGFDLQWKKG